MGGIRVKRDLKDWNITKRISHGQGCVEGSYPRPKTMTRFQDLMGSYSSLPQICLGLKGFVVVVVTNLISCLPWMACDEMSSLCKVCSPCLLVVLDWVHVIMS